MATRANIIIKDLYNKLYFYRHSDGYPSETFEDLKKFVKGYTTGKMRTNVGQSAGWLIVHGMFKDDLPDYMKWKVGNYEPTTDIHGDIEFLYVIDLSDMTLRVTDVYTKDVIDIYDFAKKGEDYGY